MSPIFSNFVRATSCFSICVAILAGTLHAEERTIAEWIEAMHEAQESRSFTGTLSFWDGVDLTTIQYSQFIVDGKPQVKLNPLNGPQREITRTEEILSISLSPDDQMREVSSTLSGKSLSRLLPPDVSKLDEIFDITHLPEDRIADRVAVGISIMPKVPDRYGYQIWIDKATALILRMEMCDCDDPQNLKNVVQFTEITILENASDIAAQSESLDDSDLTVNIVNQDLGASASAQADWELNFIPDGFVLSSTKTQDGALYNRTYSDGLNAFTIQMSPAPANKLEDIQLETMIGPTMIVSRSATDASGRPMIVTVVGDLPRRTIWKISEGIKFER